jgi:ABC-2 type transport system ATP-binding protein
VAHAIEVRGVSKRFRLYHERYSSLKERMIHFGRVPFEPFWALQNVDFTVEEGTTVGLLGHNGSGKSTLLKCVAGILQPTTGEILTRGRLAALLELGAGFNHELTGRENVFMNASILGLTKRETEAVFDEIVAFAELEKFIDMQVRHYSSGMYVRLGFAVAVNVEPDILLVDEVLSVGDEAFQRKCIDRVKRFQREGRTILFVTHAPDLVRRICDRAVVLNHGEMMIDAAPGEAVRVFRESLSGGDGLGAEPDAATNDADVPASISRASRATHRVRITGVEFEHAGNRVNRSWLLPDEALTIRVHFETQIETRDVQFGIAIYDEEGRLIFGSNTKMLGHDVVLVPGPGDVAFAFDRVPLLDGTYSVTLGVQATDEATVYDWHEQRYTFEVMNPTRTPGTVSLPLTVQFGEREMPRVDRGVG